MIVHDYFVFIHFPRTAGSYLRRKLKKIDRTRGFKETHAKVKDINFKISDKIIFSIIRNPFDWYVSEFINREYTDFEKYIKENKGHMTRLFWDTYAIENKFIHDIIFFKYEDILQYKIMHDEPFNVTENKKDYKSYYTDELIKIVQENDNYLLNRFNYKF